MILVDEAKFEKCLKITSETLYIEENPVWNNIARYRIALRLAASTEVAKESKLDGKRFVDSLIEQFFDLNICSEKVIDELLLDIPPNVQRICDHLLSGNIAASNTNNTIETFVNQLTNELSTNPHVLNYKKFLGDLYFAFCSECSDAKFNRKVYENAFRKAIEENGGFIDCLLSINKYLFKVKQDLMPSITMTYASKINKLLQPVEVDREILESFVFLAESDWYQKLFTSFS